MTMRYINLYYITLHYIDCALWSLLHGVELFCDKLSGSIIQDFISSVGMLSDGSRKIQQRFCIL